MKTNKEKLAVISVQGNIDHPTMSKDGYWVGYDGYGRICVGPGGITYNYKIGDVCMALEGDHIEPGVSLKNKDSRENNALQALACIGNKAKIISGDAKGREGFVTGKHGGVDHVMVYFDHDTLHSLTTDDKVLIHAHGLGMKLLDYPDIQVMNIDPEFLEKLQIKEHPNRIEIPVVTCIPAFLMGSGLGSTTTILGDYDIMTQDKEANITYGINDLRFGDIVLIMDHDNHNGPHYRQGAVSVGVIVHSDSFTSGHGPGVAVILTSNTNIITPIIDKHANIANYAKVNEFKSHIV